MSLTLTRRHNVDRFGYLIPHRYGNLPMVEAVATYRPGEGRFGRGAVAVEEGTTNLVPSNRLKFERWTAYSGAQVTLTQNVEFPEIGRNDATRIRTTGGTNALKYYLPIERSIADQAYTGSVYIKNIGPKPVRFYTQFGPSVTVNPGEWTRAIASGIGSGISQFQLRFQALNVDDDLDFIAWGPQAEHKPFATSFVDGTRPDGILAYPISLADDYTIACYRKSHTDKDYKHVVKLSDGKVFVDGVEDSEYDVGWIAGRNLLRNSDFSQGKLRWSTQGESGNTIEFKDGYVLLEKTGGASAPAIYQGTTSIEQETVTATVWAKGSGEIRARFGGGERLPGQNIDPEIIKPYSFVIDRSGGANRNVVFEVVEGMAEFHFVKLERGSTSTDWTPAPEDLGYDGDALMLSNQTGLVDELLILPYAASEEEIVSWYEAQGPLPPHPQALLQWDRQALTQRHNVDRFGYLIPTKYGNVPMVGAVATYRPGEGRFGRGAVAVEEGTTNLVDNPFFENGWTSWAVQNATSGSTRTIKEAEGAYGGKVAVLDRPAGGGSIGIYSGCGGGLAEGDIVTVSFRARRTKGTSNVNIRWGGGATHIVPISEEWGRYGITIPKDGNQNIIFEVRSDDSTIELDAIQVETKPFATSFVDGTRANGRLGYEQFPEGPFTVAVWGKTFDSRKVHRMPFGKWNRFYYSVDPSNKLLLSWVDSTNTQKTAGGSITIDPLDWHFYVLTWDGTTLIGYVDGDEHVRATPDMAQPGGTFGWGNYHGGGGGYLWNGLLDEGLILPYAASEEEIRAWYEADGPIPPHPAALLQWDRQTVRPAQMMKL